MRAPLGGQTADVYVPLAQLQKLSSQKGQVNVVLVRADSGDDVASVQQNIENQYPSAQVASARDVADRISGSLVDASNLSHRLGVALAVLAALTAFLIALLLTLSSVGKRVREIGTLKALGWKQRVVVRQILGESLAQGARRRADRRRPRRRARGRDRRRRADADGVLVDGAAAASTSSGSARSPPGRSPTRSRSPRRSR